VRTSRLIAEGRYYATLSYGGVVEISEMKALTWKAVLAALNPSPVFAAIAMFAAELAMTDNEFVGNKSTDANRCTFVLQKQSALDARSDKNES
jgi:hypothetical protein